MFTFVEASIPPPPVLPQRHKKILKSYIGFIHCGFGGGARQGGGGYNPFILLKERAMYDKKKLDELKNSVENWEETTLQKALSSLPERANQFITTSSEPINRLYTPLDVAEIGRAHV